MSQTDTLCINTIRMLAVDAIEKAKSGHPGLPLGAAPMAYVLWTRHLRFNPATPRWPNRDRFVLSGGHGSMLLYAMLHLTGYELPLDEIKNFRQWGSLTPGHPERGHDGVEVTTGPLGQGISNAVGLAIGEAHMAARFNREGFPLVDHYTYVIASDGDLMEGVANEACALAGHLGLGKLIVLHDDNRITLAGSTDLSFTEDHAKHYEAYGWHVQTIEDGNDIAAIDAAHRGRKEGDRQALPHLRADDHRLRLAPQAGVLRIPRLSPGPQGDRGDQEESRLAAGADVQCARRGTEGFPRGPVQGKATRRPVVRHAHPVREGLPGNGR